MIIQLDEKRLRYMCNRNCHVNIGNRMYLLEATYIYENNEKIFNVSIPSDIEAEIAVETIDRIERLLANGIMSDKFTIKYHDEYDLVQEAKIEFYIDPTITFCKLSIPITVEKYNYKGTCNVLYDPITFSDGFCYIDWESIRPTDDENELILNTVIDIIKSKLLPKHNIIIYPQIKLMSDRDTVC